ncbi:hypothetical protein [Allorhodopirellula solitaria]|nr:hypothetical protein [Allorhodopirellula solitaria]
MLLAPSSLAVTYLSISFGLGAFALRSDVATTLRDTRAGVGFWYSLSSSAPTIAGVLLGSIYLITLSFIANWRSKGRDMLSQGLPGMPSRSTFIVVCIAVALLVTFSVFPLNLSVLGASDDISYPVRLLCCIALFAACQNRRPLVRYAVYLAAAAPMAMMSFHSKREALFVVIAAITVELMAHNEPLKVSFRRIGLALLAASVVFVFILWASVMRGYGGYHPTSAIEGVRYIPQYVQEPYFIETATSNFETNSTISHTANCIHMIRTGELKMQWGATLCKFVFLPVPRRYFPGKPESMIAVYTQHVASKFYEIGGSFPVTLPGELYANFGIPGLVLVVPLFMVLDSFFFSAARSIGEDPFGFSVLLAVYLGSSSVMLVRGSGLDIYIVYAAIAAVPAIVFGVVAGRRLPWRIRIN